MIKKYIMHIRNLKQALNHGLVFKAIHRVIKFNKKALLKSYFDWNTLPRKKAKSDSEKYFFKLVNNAIVRKTLENVRNGRDI